jgi:hypothetical protein
MGGSTHLIIRAGQRSRRNRGGDDRKWGCIIAVFVVLIGILLGLIFLK